MVNNITIPIKTGICEISLILFSEKTSKQTIFEIDKSDAFVNGESPYQIKEGHFYEYKITEGYSLQPSEVVTNSNINKSWGRISPNIYVGTLKIDVLDSNDMKCSEISLEVQSVKTGYRDDYRIMLEEITDNCTDLLLYHNSPVSQYFETDYNFNATTLYQRFAFIKSILDSEEFNDSVHKILLSPVTKWKESETQKSFTNIKKINKQVVQQLISSPNRIQLPQTHLLRKVLNSIPAKLSLTQKRETVDTPENRFVKYALESFLKFLWILKDNKYSGTRLRSEVLVLEVKLEEYLNHSIFKEIQNPTTLPLNSPILQRKEGYREILRVWLMFDLAAKLVWRGGEDVYSGNKKDVAVLYEYWLFFKLLSIIKEVFKIEPSSIEALIENTGDGLDLKLRQGIYLPIKGIYDAGTRKLNIEFSYNKTFSGEKEYPQRGSWTRNLRPDYTLSVWPLGISQKQAEHEELIVHIHFDAKYRVENLQKIFGDTEYINEEKEEQSKGIYKRADLFKMHTYKDAIRRTAGAYVLYPGSEKPYTFKGFHEILPGLGAFSIRPSKLNTGSEDLKIFLQNVIKHFLNRASQREKMLFQTYDIHVSKIVNELNVLLPETFKDNRGLLPDSTFVLVAFYRTEKQLEWIEKKFLYNARAGDTKGSLRLSPKETGAKYLLLRSYNETKATKLYKLKNKGPRIFSKQDLINKSYPDIPGQPFYLVYDIEEKLEIEFENLVWDITKLDDYIKGPKSAIPFAISISELMKVVIKK